MNNTIYQIKEFNIKQKTKQKSKLFFFYKLNIISFLCIFLNISFLNLYLFGFNIKSIKTKLNK